ncbi:MAG: hypothetical protein EXS37_18980, partial [Opitutus sp.]|nr:hypothetical protein [Opitutus sp.]
MLRSLLGVITLGILVVAPGIAMPLQLVVEGEPRATIVLADQPSAAAREGAALLVAQIERISGARLPVVKEGALGGLNIVDRSITVATPGAAPHVFVLVGESALARQLGATGEGLGAGGILIRTLPNALVLLGTD